MSEKEERGVVTSYLAVLIAVIGLSGSGPLGKLATNQGLDPAVLSFYRIALSMIIILPVVLHKKDRREEVRDVFKFNPSLLLLSVLAAAFLALHYITWYSSVTLTTVYRATVISDMSPLFAMLCGWILLGDRPKWRQVVSVGIAIVGVVIISAKGGDKGGSLTGDFMALLAGLGWAVYFVFGQKIRRGLSVWVYTLIVNTICAIFLLGYILITHKTFFITPTIVSVTVFVALFGTLIGHTLLNWALPVAGATFVSLACLAEAFVGAFVAWLLFSEVPTVVTFAGGVICLIGLAAYSLWHGKKKETDMIKD